MPVWLYCAPTGAAAYLLRTRASVAFYCAPTGAACIKDGNPLVRPHDDLYIVLEPEDEPEMIAKRCPDLAAYFQLIAGAFHISYGDAMLLFHIS